MFSRFANPTRSENSSMVWGEIYIDRNDFMEAPPKKYFRLALGQEVRLKYAYYVTCKDVVKDDNGEVIEII
jgi:glutaminyl-tRNA synthetase